MAIAIYARQSIDKKDSLSIETQIDLCKRGYDENSDIVVYQDKGYSGKNIDRPDMKRLMADIEMGKIERVICYKLDRLSRSILDFANMWTLMDKHNVQFCSVNEKFDTGSPMGRAMIYIIMVFAQLERETIALRVKDNYYKRLTKGTWLGGPAPYGFDNGHKKVNGKSVPTILPNDNIEIVKYIFDRYMEQGVSLGDIARDLTQRRIPCAKRKSWDNVSLSRILHSPLYVKADLNVYSYYKTQGVSEFANAIDEFDGTTSANIIGKKTGQNVRKYNQLRDCVVMLTNSEGIIPSGKWLAVQDKLSHNKQITNKNRGKYTWLVGLLKCKKCGYSITVKTWKVKNGIKQGVYCSGHTSLNCCDVMKFDIQLDEVETEIEKKLTKILAEYNESQEPELYEDEKTSGIKLEILKINNQIDRLIKNMEESDEVVSKYIMDEIRNLDKEKQKLEAEAEKNRKSVQRKVKDIVFAELSNEEKNLVASCFIDKILVENDTVEVMWKV